uniref:Glycosyltransferase n=1 Tax=viral metagenome TaxID=1070528 RepID=A0A6C0I449_9ZZZZ
MSTFTKVIVWGFPLHTHTHSYIHYGWDKTFRHLGHETHWFHDNAEIPAGFDFTNCLFLTEGYADDKIPINDSSIYFVHIARRPEKYVGKVKRFIEIRYLVDSIVDCNYNYALDKDACQKISDCTYYEKLHDNGGLAKHHDNPIKMEYECIYTCWATDLLPHEIVDENVELERDNKIYWFGTSNHLNTREIALFNNECRKNNVEFVANDPWKNPLPFEVVQAYTMRSLMAPDFRSSGDPRKIALGETGTCHKFTGYIPCRLLKSISYGHLGITNSQHAYELLEKKVVYNDDEAALFYDAMKELKNYDLIKEQMAIVREKHTYVNRVNDLLAVLRI